MKMFLQNARFFAKCKLHPARFAIDKAADAVGKRGDFMQSPILWSECIQHRNPLSGRKRQLVNHKFINKIIEEKPAKQFHRFRFYDFGKVSEWIVPVVFLAKQIKDGMGQYKGQAAFTPKGEPPPVVSYPGHKCSGRFRKETVQCYCRHNLNPCHSFHSFFNRKTQKKSVQSTLSLMEALECP